MDVEEQYRKVQDLLSLQEFEGRVAEVKAQYDDLLDDEAAALLIVDEMGGNKGVDKQIHDLVDGETATVCGVIEEVSPLRTFRKKTGGHGQVQNLTISDGTDRCRVVLWGQDVEKIPEMDLRPGVRVRLINGRVKDGKWGLEVSHGRDSLLVKE